MEKLVYLLHADAGASGTDLRNSLLGPVRQALEAGGAQRITANLDDEDVAQGSGVLIRKNPVPIRAVVSFWMENSDDRAACEAALGGICDVLHGYLVVESVPLVNTDHVAPLGERTPGANLVTCIKQLGTISHDEFLDRWYEEHKKVALETQSTFAYVRNTVVRALTDNAPPWDGIVEESFPIEALTDPLVWYDANGSQELYEKRLEQMIASVQAFLDLSELESTPMSEYVLSR